ncbi:MAG: alpha/beta fold hydrolase [Gemmatales bacterium]
MNGAFAHLTVFSNDPASESEISRSLPAEWQWFVVYLLVALIVLWAVLSFAIARYSVVRRSPPYLEKLPEADQKVFTEHRLITDDGQTIGSWYAEGLPGCPVVVLVHGNQNDRSQCLPYARLFNELGCGTLLITMRTHGDSSGTVNDFGYGARQDVIAAVKFLRQRAAGRPILLFGISAGATAVSFAARELGNQVVGVVMEEPFLNIMTAVDRRTKLMLPWGLSHIAYAGLYAAARIVLPHFPMISPVNAVTGIPQSVPIWILAGGKDTKALPEEAQAIYQKASSHADLVVFPEATHESLLEHDPARYRELARKWVATVSISV